MAFGALTLLVLCREGHPARKYLTDEVQCWHGYLLGRSANSLHAVQLMLQLPHHVCISKIQNGLYFWYRLTWVVPDKGRETVVVVVSLQLFFLIQIHY